MDSSMSFSLMPPPGQQTQSSGHRYSVQEWEEQKTTIQKLYIDEDRRLKDVIHILSQQGFIVTYGCDLF
jgi:hypothetical protein